MKKLLLLLFLIPNLVMGGVILDLESSYESSHGLERFLYVIIIAAGFWIPIILLGNLINKLKSEWGRMILWVLLIWGITILAAIDLKSMPQNPIFYVLIILFVTAVYKYNIRDIGIDKYDNWTKPKAFFNSNIIGWMFALCTTQFFLKY